MYDDPRQYLEQLSELKLQRTQWSSLMKEVGDYLLTRRYHDPLQGDPPNQGDARTSRIVDTTGTKAVQMLGSGMRSGLSSPSQPWFKLGLDDEDMEDWGPVRHWLAAVEKAQYRTLARGNFYNAAHQVYIDQAAFGQAPVFQEESLEAVNRFVLYSPGEYYLAEGPDGRVDTVFRVFHMSADNAARRFGPDALSPMAKQLADEPASKNKFLRLVHAYHPAFGKKPKFAFASVYFELDQPDKFLSKGGFNEAAVHTPRWSVSGSDAYGRSPGFDQLPDVKMLQKEREDQLIQISKVGDPPVVMPPNYNGKRANTLPGGVISGDETASDLPRALYQVQPDLNALRQEIMETRQMIRDGFFNSLWLLLNDHPNITATAVIEMKYEKLTLLGPTIDSQIYEFLEPVLTRNFYCLERMGALPPPPPDLAGREIKIRFISLLAKSREMIGIDGLRAQTSYAMELMNLDPGVADKIDADQSLDEFNRMVGAPVKSIRTDEEVAQMRQQRAQAAAERQQREQQSAQLAGLAQAAQTAKTLSDTDTSGPNALTKLSAALERQAGQGQAGQGQAG